MNKALHINFIRSEGHLENNPDLPEPVCPSFIRAHLTGRPFTVLTYSNLRLDMDEYKDEHIAYCSEEEGDWVISSNALKDQGVRKGMRFSDIEIDADLGCTEDCKLAPTITQDDVAPMSDALRWLANHLDIMDKMLLMLAKIQGWDAEKLKSNAVQEDLEQLATWLETEMPDLNQEMTRHMDHWAHDSSQGLIS